MYPLFPVSLIYFFNLNYFHCLPSFLTLTNGPALFHLVACQIWPTLATTLRHYRRPSHVVQQSTAALPSVSGHGKVEESCIMNVTPTLREPLPQPFHAQVWGNLVSVLWCPANRNGEWTTLHTVTSLLTH